MSVLLGQVPVVNANIFTQRPSSHAPEVCSADPPEALHDPRATPLQVPFPDASERDHEPRDFAPEVELDQSPEALKQQKSMDLTSRSGPDERIHKMLSWK